MRGRGTLLLHSTVARGLSTQSSAHPSGACSTTKTYCRAEGQLSSPTLERSARVVVVKLVFAWPRGASMPLVRTREGLTGHGRSTRATVSKALRRGPHALQGGHWPRQSRLSTS